VCDEKDEEEDGADGELGHQCHCDEQCAADAVADQVCLLRSDALEDVTEEEGEKVADDHRTEDADGLEHLDEAGTLFSGFRLRIFLTEEHQAVDDGRDEVEGELDLPVELHFVIKKPACGDTEDHAGWPCGVHHVEVVRALLGVERRNERVGDGFEGSVCECEKEHAPKEEAVGVFGGTRAEGDESGKDMAKEGNDDEFPVADLIDDHTADDDSETEAGESRATDRAELRPGKTVFLGPVVEDASADGEAYACGEDGDESGPEEPASVWCDCVLVTHWVNRMFCGIIGLRSTWQAFGCGNLGFFVWMRRVLPKLREPKFLHFLTINRIRGAS